MGQYHAIYNIDKKEMINPHSVCAGAKLMEWHGSAFLTGLAVLLANSNGRGGGDLWVYVEGSFDAEGNYVRGEASTLQATMRAAIARVAGRWAGDRIVVQGDYAEAGDRAFIDDDNKPGYLDISALVVNALACDTYVRDEMAKDYSVTAGRVSLPDYSEKPAKKARKPRAKKAKPAA